MAKTEAAPAKEKSFVDKIKQRFTNMSTEEKVAYGLLAIIIILVYSIRSKLLSLPFERDEGAYAYYGKMILEGKVPYVDFYEQKLPGVFYFYAMIVKLFGSTVEELHTGFIWVNIISVIFIYLAAKKLYSPFAGVIAAVTFGIVSLTPFLSGFTIQSEHGVALWTCIGLYFYALSDKSDKNWILYVMGVFMGLAFMTKTTGLYMAFAGGLIVLSDNFFKKTGLKKTIVKAFIYTAGVVTVGLFFLALIAAKGSFNEMVYWAYELPFKYYSTRIPWEQGKQYLQLYYQMITKDYKFFWIHGYLALPLLLVRTIDVRYKIAAVIVFGLCFYAIFPGNYFYGHYWIQIMPGLALASGLTFHLIHKTLTDRLKLKFKWIPYAYLGVFGILVFNHLSSQKSYYFHPNPDRIVKTVYGGNPFPESMEIAKHLNTISKPEDQVAIIGSEPEVFIYTNKTSPTRHIFFSTIVAELPQHKGWQREFVADIEKAKPKYILFYNVAISLLVQQNTDKYVFEWSNKYITDNYKTIGIVDMPDNAAPTYIWGEANVATYKQVGPNIIYLFERKQ